MNNHKKLSIVCLAIFVFVVAFAGEANAAVFTVDTTSGGIVAGCTAAPNDCSLRGAVLGAQTNADTSDDIFFDSTVFSGGQVISLNSDGGAGPILFNNQDSIRITAAANAVTISGAGTAGNTQIFDISNDSSLTLSMIILRDGVNATGNGGAVSVGAGDNKFSASFCQFINNSAALGGGIYSAGNSTITNSTFTGNSAMSGGAFYQAGGFGASSVLFSNSTIAGNSATDNGGGIAAVGAFNQSRAQITTDSTTIAFNRVSSSTGLGGGVFASNNAFYSFQNTIISNNTAAVSTNGPDGAATGSPQVGVFFSNIFTLVGTTAGFPITPGTGSQFNVDPLLDSNGTQNNGGPTPTISLQTGSPAIDSGNSPRPIDQRGFTRPIDQPNVANTGGGNASDIGAFEVQAPTAAGAALTGRIIDGKRGVRGAYLQLISNESGEVLTARTNMFGYFQFENVGIGTYIINVYAKRHQTASRAVNILGELNLTINLGNGGSTDSFFRKYKD